MSIRTISDISGKKITLLGLGLLGRGIAVAKYLASKGAILHITDKKTEEELSSSLTQLSDISSITYHLGGHDVSDINGADLIIKAASVPLDSPYIAYANKKSIPIEMDASLFCRLKPKGVTVIGITGTRGKSTTAYVLHHILTTNGVPSHIGGNIKGGATLPLLDLVKEGDVVVLELDSWQLQGFGDAKISPEVAIFTTFYPDHMNYYKGDMQAYFNDKANIFAYQTKSDELIVTRQSNEKIAEYWDKSIVSKKTILDENNYNNLSLLVPGAHTKMNVGLAIEASVLYGIAREDAIRSAEIFPGVPYRLEYVTSIEGVDYYNDSNATSPEAVKAALDSFPERSISLITGGTDKELIIEDLAHAINDAKPQVTLLPGTATERLKPLLSVPYTEASSMKEAVEKAKEKATEKGIVLLSPGAASFGLFVNEYDRGDQFRDEVLRIEKST